MTITDRYHFWACCRCGAQQAMTVEAHAVYRQNHAGFYCVHGHVQHFPEGPSEADRLRDQLEQERRARQRAEQRIAEARDQAQAERNRANGYKGFAARMTKRAKAGVCPCCNRTVKQLAQHMASKHPNFTPLEADA